MKHSCKRSPHEHFEFKQFKENCFAVAKERFQGKSFFNIDKGVEIKVSRTGLNEWFSKTRSYEQAQSILCLDVILQEALYSHSSANAHPKKGDEKSTFDYFTHSIILEEHGFSVVLTIKNVAGAGSIYYHHYLVESHEEKSSRPQA